MSTSELAESLPDTEALRREIASIVKRCAEGDRLAMQVLYQKVSPRLFGVALRLMRRESLAEEVLQEAFIKIWRNASSYSPDLAAPLTWMTSIVRNEALDTLRRRRIREDHEAPQPDYLAELIPDGARNIDDSLVDAEVLMTCLERLEPPARDCIVRAYCEGYSHDELSEAHQRPLGTVKSWIRRGLISLRSCVDELS